ncbi:MAG TPA: ATP-binding protein, partial [Clostridia bacterium]|nr:ATP-binding protein [Clostridia bacterium]
MYIGSTGARGLHHILWEIVDNSIDEAANGFADNIKVCINEDNSVTVEDNGRGMPVDIHPTKGIPGVEVIYTQLHAGGKFDSSNYSYSGGLHGVGASVVNALSEWTIVEIYRDCKHYRIEFESKFDKNEGKVVAGRTRMPLKEIGTTWKRGSKTTFKPDPTIFDTVNFNAETVARRLKELAFLNKGLKIEFSDLRENSEYKNTVFSYDGGIVDFVRYLNEDKNPLFEKPIYLEGMKNDIYCEAAILYNDSYTESIFSYVNNIPTSEGGTHETGFKSAWTKVLNDHPIKASFVKDKDVSFSGEDFREGISVVLTVKMRNIQFEGQTKTKLGNTEARTAVETIISEKLTEYLNDLRNGEETQIIYEKAVQAAKVRSAARKAKELARKRSSL